MKAMDDSADLVVRDNPEEERYEAWAGERRAGFVDYSRDGDTLEVLHTEVTPEFEGQGVGAALARIVLDEARAAGLQVNPECPFTARWIARHPDYEDLVPERWRDRIARAKH
jgi:predicted GNAT family acetyltransferase